MVSRMQNKKKMKIDKLIKKNIKIKNELLQTCRTGNGTNRSEPFNMILLWYNNLELRFAIPKL